MFSLSKIYIGIVQYGIVDVLHFLLEQRMRRTLRPHEDALLDFAVNMLVRQLFADKAVVFHSITSGVLTFVINGGLRVLSYRRQRRDAE